MGCGKRSLQKLDGKTLKYKVMKTGSSEKIGFLENAPGEKSSQRLIYVIGMIWGMLLISFIIYLKAYKQLSVQWVELSGFATVVFGIIQGSKYFAKGQENTADKDALMLKRPDKAPEVTQQPAPVTTS